MTIFDMGPFGPFIWFAYATSFVALCAASLWTVLAYFKAKSRLALLEKS